MLRYRNAKCNSNSITEISEHNTLLMVKTKIVYDGQIFITYLCNNIKLADLQNELMSLCGLKNEVSTLNYDINFYHFDIFYNSHLDIQIIKYILFTLTEKHFAHFVMNEFGASVGKDVSVLLVEL